MKKLVLSIGAAILVALLAILGLNIYSGHGPREKVKAPDGTKVVTEELSYYIRGGKVFGKIYKPDDGDASLSRPLVVYFHEPLKTDFPESVLKALATDGLSGYATGFRGKDSDAVSIVKRLSKEEFAEKDMIFVVSDWQPRNSGTVSRAWSLSTRIPQVRHVRSTRSTAGSS